MRSSGRRFGETTASVMKIKKVFRKKRFLLKKTFSVHSFLKCRAAHIFKCGKLKWWFWFLSLGVQQMKSSWSVFVGYHILGMFSQHNITEIKTVVLFNGKINEESVITTLCSWWFSRLQMCQYFQLFSLFLMKFIVEIRISLGSSLPPPVGTSSNYPSK